MAEDFRSVGQEVRNWGRWGSSDEPGTLNLVTPDKIATAARLARGGAMFELGIPFDSKGPQVGDDRVNPMRFMSETGADQIFPGGFQYADDYVFMALQSASSIRLSVGRPRARLLRRPAVQRLPIGSRRRAWRRQVLHRQDRRRDRRPGRPSGYRPVNRGRLARCGNRDHAEGARRRRTTQGVAIESGDILPIRTGWGKMYLHTGDRRAFMETEPGLGHDSARWLREHDVAAVCADNSAVEVTRQENSGEILGVHMVLIRDMGLALGELLDFEELADDCASDGIYEFFFCGPPIKSTGAVGSPTNPLAIK